MKCSLNILTRVEGDVRSADFSCTLTEGDAQARILYVQDGDPSVLVLGEDFLTMERRGAVKLSARFSLAASLMTMQGSTLTEIPVKTISYALERSPLRYCADLVYDVYFCSEPSRFHLTITIYQEES